MKILGTILLGLILLFCGGCAILLLPDLIRGTGPYNFGGLFYPNAAIAGAAAFFIWLIWRKRPDPPEDKEP